MRFPRYTPLLALLAACLFFFGCSTPLPESEDGSVAVSYAVADEEPTPAPVPTARSGNPVWLFYQNFYKAAQDQLDGFHEALAQSSAPEALECELLLSALEERLTEGMVSFGLLMSADTDISLSYGDYASSVTGAASGSGTITTGDGGSAMLSFAYLDGDMLAGTLTPYRLRYARHAPDQTVVYTILLLRSKKGWAATLDAEGGPTYVLRCGENQTGFYAIGPSAASAGVSPMPTPSVITYDNCVNGATQSWIYSQQEGLTISGLE
ncbi:MAG: hypothetical protein VB049_10865 [Candidatus Pelethousia sp.]|nr:hypothetical protein [Candidatus Pelethousia sp.]